MNDKNRDPLKDLRGPPSDKLIKEELERYLGPPDGTCHHCRAAADALPDVGPLRITIDMPNYGYIMEPGAPPRGTYTHDFCCWECLAQWAANQAGGEFRQLCPNILPR